MTSKADIHLVLHRATGDPEHLKSARGFVEKMASGLSEVEQSVFWSDSVLARRLLDQETKRYTSAHNKKFIMRKKEEGILRSCEAMLGSLGRRVQVFE